MGQPRNNVLAEQMFARYQQGLSLADIAAEVGRSRQSVYEMFKRRSWSLRSPTLQVALTYDGQKYTLDADGYYRRTSGSKGHREWLHHAVWKNAYGPIPDGYDIHHRNHNKTDNSIDNLECLSPNEHAKRHNPLLPIAPKTCLFCGLALVRKRQPSGRLETPAEVKRRVYCDFACKSAALIGQPAGWGPKRAHADNSLSMRSLS